MTFSFDELLKDQHSMQHYYMLTGERERGGGGEGVEEDRNSRRYREVEGKTERETERKIQRKKERETERDKKRERERDRDRDR